METVVGINLETTHHSNLFELIEDVSKHTRATGDVVLSSDRRPASKVCWVAVPADPHKPCREWTIRLSEISRSMVNVPPEKVHLRATLAKYVGSAWGRALIAVAFPGQRHSSSLAGRELDVTPTADGRWETLDGLIFDKAAEATKHVLDARAQVEEARKNPPLKLK